MDALAALRLQMDWGADEALDETPVDRLAPRAPPAAAILLAEAASAAAPLQPRPAAPQARAAAIAGAADTVEQLRAALAGFDGCGLSATASHMVFADGAPSASLMLVGDVPGDAEDRAGRPFVGPPGQLLDRMLASIGLDRTACLLTNLIPWRPPGNRTPTAPEILLCLPFLLRHIALVRPRRLVLLGAIATAALTGSNAGIRRMRGKWVPAAIPGLEAPVPALPMLHPAHLLRTPGAKRDAWADLRLLRHTLDADTAET